MSDRFICIACWQEFLVSPVERGARGGKVVCPHCGYIQTATSVPASTDAEDDSDVSAEVSPPQEAPKPSSWTADAPRNPTVKTTSSYEGTDGGTEENSDPQMGEDSTSELPDVPETFEGEPTPPEGYDPAFGDSESDDVEAPFSESAVVLGTASSVDNVAYNSSDAIPESPAQFVWQLKTSSGLKLKFNDMESLLGWRQKVSGSSQAEISPDGQRWTDFASFVHDYEELGDPWRAFLHAAKLNEDEPPPPSSSTASQASLRPLSNGENGSSGNGSRNGNSSRPGYSADSLQNNLPKATAPNQFTFQVTQKPKSPVGKYFILGVAGAVLLVGAVVALLYYSGQL